MADIELPGLPAVGIPESTLAGLGLSVIGGAIRGGLTGALQAFLGPYINITGRPKLQATEDIARRALASMNPVYQQFGGQVARLAHAGIPISVSSGPGTVAYGTVFHDLVLGLESQGQTLARARSLADWAVSPQAQIASVATPHALQVAPLAAIAPPPVVPQPPPVAPPPVIPLPPQVPQPVPAPPPAPVIPPFQPAPQPQPIIPQPPPAITPTPVVPTFQPPSPPSFPSIVAHNLVQFGESVTEAALIARQLATHGVPLVPSIALGLGSTQLPTPVTTGRPPGPPPDYVIGQQPTGLQPITPLGQHATMTPTTISNIPRISPQDGGMSPLLDTTKPCAGCGQLGQQQQEVIRSIQTEQQQLQSQQTQQNQQQIQQFQQQEQLPLPQTPEQIQTSIEQKLQLLQSINQQIANAQNQSAQTISSQIPPGQVIPPEGQLTPNTPLVSDMSPQSGQAQTSSSITPGTATHSLSAPQPVTFCITCESIADALKYQSGEGSGANCYLTQ